MSAEGVSGSGDDPLKRGPGGWRVEHLTGSAGELHHRPFSNADARSVWAMEVAGPAVVLGSTQAEALIDTSVAAALGVEVARRRSGGGAVWLDPTDSVWIDLVIARDDPLWHDDIGMAMWWIGRAWVDALRSLGQTGLAVHEGRLMSTPWSRLICFDGLGPGEVTADGAKLVGISQRRTREGARFQCVAYRRWDPEPMLAVLRQPKPDSAALRSIATVRHDGDAILAALVAALP